MSTSLGLYTSTSLSEVLATSSTSGGIGTGADGRSAYQIAVDQGFVGTQSEWLESLETGDFGFLSIMDNTPEKELLANNRILLENNSGNIIDRLKGDFNRHSFFSNNVFTPRNLNDSYLLVIQFEINPEEIETNFSIDLESNSINISKILKTLDHEIGTYKIYKSSFEFFIDQNFIDNGGMFYIETNKDVLFRNLTYKLFPLSSGST